MGAGGVTWLSKRTRADARVQGELLLEQAKEGVLSGLHEDDNRRIDNTTEVAAADVEVAEVQVAEVAAAEAELASWLEGAIPLKAPAGSQLAQRLFAAGLTQARMVEAAAHPGGFQSLCDLLTMGNVGMRPGDALALASAAMSDAGRREGRSASGVGNSQELVA